MNTKANATMGQVIGISGRFRLELHNNDTGAIDKVLEFDNAVLDTALRALCGEGNNDTALTGLIGAIGTSNTPVDPTTQTGLLSGVILANTGSTTDWAHDVNTTTAPYWVERTRRQIFQTGISGTFREVGMRSSAVNLWFSRALISDSNGNPIDLPVSANQTLIMFYSIRIYPPMADVDQTVAVTGKSPGNHAVKLRAANVLGSGSGWWVNYFLSGLVQQYYGRSASLYYGPNCVLGPMTGTPDSPDGAYGTGSGIAYEARPYVAGTMYRTIRMVIPTEMANSAKGIGAAYLSYSHTLNVQLSISPPLMKTQFDVLTFDIRFTLSRAS